MFRALYLNRRNKAGCKYNAHFWDCYPETTLRGIKARNNKLCYFSIMKDFRFIQHMQQLIWFTAPGEPQCFKNQSTPSILGMLKWQLVAKQNIWTWGSCPVLITPFLMQVGFSEASRSSFQLLLTLVLELRKSHGLTEHSVRSRRKCFTLIVKVWWDKTRIVSHPHRAASRGSSPCLEHIHPELGNSKGAKPRPTLREAQGSCMPAAWCIRAGWGEQQQQRTAPGAALGVKVKRMFLEDRSNVSVSRLLLHKGVYNHVICCAFNAFLSFHQLQIRKHPKAGDSMLNLLLSATINSFSWLFKTQLYQVSTRKRMKMALTSICCTAVPPPSLSLKAHQSHITPLLPSKERTPSATSL